MCSNIDYTDLEQELKANLSEKRYRHCLGVAKTCLFLNEHYSQQLDASQLYISGLMHDMAREWSKEQLVDYALAHQLRLTGEEQESPVLLHAPVGAALLSERGYSQEICTAVRYHSIGSIHMGRLGLLLYLADYLEPNRTHLAAQDRDPLLELPTPEVLCLAVLERERPYLVSKGKQISKCGEELYRFLLGGGAL